MHGRSWSAKREPGRGRARIVAAATASVRSQRATTHAALIRVLLIGDVRLSREGIADVLRRDGRIHVTATSTSADDRSLSGARDADVIVIDIAGGCLAASAWLMAEATRTPIVAFGVSDGDDAVIQFAEAGVIGFVDREADVGELVAGIQAAARREAWCPPPIATALLKRIRTLAVERAEPRASSSLTTREHQIVELIAEGLTNKEIARRLCIEIATVKNHVHNILDKLQVRRRADAAARMRLVEGARPDQPEGSSTQSMPRRSLGPSRSTASA
jgi:two-component system nitrate/nitrite response regulator NarL